MADPRSTSARPAGATGVIVFADGRTVWGRGFGAERSAVGDHFGWHPAAGPDVDQRDGHVFVGNLLVADARFPKALLRADQVKLLQGKLTKAPFATDQFGSERGASHIHLDGQQPSGE